MTGAGEGEARGEHTAYNRSRVTLATGFKANNNILVVICTCGFSTQKAVRVGKLEASLGNITSQSPGEQDLEVIPTPKTLHLEVTGGPP